MKHHTGETLFKGFVSYIKLSQSNCIAHYRRHQTRDGLQKCPLCGNECVKGFCVEQQGRYHTGEDPDICSICFMKCYIAIYLGNYVQIQLMIIYNILIRVESPNHNRP